MASFRPSGISVNIREDLVEGTSRTQTTLVVDPIITKDGHRVTMADMGDIAYAKLDQGNASEEIISFTGITDNTTTYTLTGCVWGYNFYNNTGSVTANKKRHFSGAKFIITNDDHFLDTQYGQLDEDNLFTGDCEFTKNIEIGDDTTATDKKVLARNGDANYPFVAYDESANEWVISNDGVSSTAIGGGASVYTGGDGIDVTASVVSVDLVAINPGLEISGNKLRAISKFSGTGSDGALTVASGTTNIDAAGANVVVKNYTSINISAGATLGLTNPSSDGTILILKSQGDVTIAGTIDLDGKGGSAGNTGYDILDDLTHRGSGGQNGTFGLNGTGGTGGVVYSNKYLYITPDEKRIYKKFISLACGSGGGDGGDSYSTSSIGGDGGAGGGAILIQCGNNLDFSGTIKLNGIDGTDATSGSADAGGGGGGGACGMALILYNSLTANTGTIEASGGDGGDTPADGGGGGDYSGGGGGGAGSYSGAGGDGGDSGINGGNGAAGAGAGGGGGSSSSGGTGGSSDSNMYLVIKNTEF